MDFSELLQCDPYGQDKQTKNKILTKRLAELTRLHREKCPAYRQMLQVMGYEEKEADSYTNLPFLPVRVFKELSLKSVDDGDVVKTMTSSGTSGQAVSRIYLDRTTAANQQKAMVKIVSDFTGSARMPMIIVDCPSVVKDRAMFSARGAGILGFSIFGSRKIYALNDDMELDVDGIRAFLEAHRGERIFLFGFTFMIWQHFYKELVRLQQEEGLTLDLSDAVMIHGGGWKKLTHEAVSPEEFHDRLKAVCGLDCIHDYYGMVEQTGCIYMQCECGHLHASIFSDVIVRRSRDFGVCDIGEPGIIQVVSSIPESYPGHSLLTEDEGVILGEDDCPCDRKGKYFKVLGRIQNAEIRGCSDTYAADYGRRAVEITYPIGNDDVVAGMAALPAREPFDIQIMDFCGAVSKVLLTDRDAKAYPDVVTLGFWLRPSSLAGLKDRFGGGERNGSRADAGKDVVRMGRGMVFHIAPSNVPVNFAYSLFAGLITGNANVVRLPSKAFPQVDLICRVINRVLEDYPSVKPYIALVRYGRDRNVNNRFSAMCDVRVVWGGDATIAELRQSPIGPRSTEITFADRYSLALIDADYYLAAEDKDSIARNFYNDTFLSDQNACTSPRIVIWHGQDETVAEAKKLFWDSFHRLSEQKYVLKPVQCVDKLTTACIAAVECSDLGLHMLERPDNLIVRIHADGLSERLMDYRGNSGYFYEYDLCGMDDLAAICSSVRCQTIGLLGDSEILRPLIMTGIKGVDRIVPIGRTMDFDLLWDGYDLTDRLTRNIVIG